MSYRVHSFELDMKRDQTRLEQFLNSLTGEIVAVLPNVIGGPAGGAAVDFLLIIERADEGRLARFDKGEKMAEEIAVP